MGAASLVIPVVVALLPAARRRTHTAAAAAAAAAALAPQWASSGLGKLLQGCVQVDFRTVGDEEGMLRKTSDLRRALFCAIAAPANLTSLTTLVPGSWCLKAPKTT